MKKIVETDDRVIFKEDLGWRSEKTGKMGVAIILHGSGASPVNNNTLAKGLYKDGYGIISPLIAGHGLGGHSPECENDDMLAQLAVLVTRVKNKGHFCTVIGTSMGGTLALLSGIFEKKPDLIVSVCGALTPNPDPRDIWSQKLNNLKEFCYHRLREIHVPTLIIHDLMDKEVPLQDSLTFFNHIPTPRKKCAFYNGAGHSILFSRFAPEIVRDIKTFRKFTHKPELVTFNYHGRASHIFLSGEFNNWSHHRTPMTEVSPGHFQCEMALEPGTHPYKYIVDGEWILDPKSKSVTTPNGEKNSLLTVG